MDVCVVCRRPVPWHFEEGRKLDCVELDIRITGITPRYTSCTSAQMWRDVKTIERARAKRRVKV